MKPKQTFGSDSNSKMGVRIWGILPYNVGPQNCPFLVFNDIHVYSVSQKVALFLKLFVIF